MSGPHLVPSPRSGLRMSSSGRAGWCGRGRRRAAWPPTGCGWPRAGISPRRTGCCSADGGPIPAWPGHGYTAWPRIRCRLTGRLTCSAWTTVTAAIRWRRTGTCARSGSAAAGPTARTGSPGGRSWRGRSPGSSNRRWPRCRTGRWRSRRPAASPPPNCCAPSFLPTGCRWTGRSRRRCWPGSSGPGRGARPRRWPPGPHGTPKCCGTRRRA